MAATWSGGYCATSCVAAGSLQICLDKGNLEIHRVVIIPILFTSNIVSHAKQQCLRLKIDLVAKPDFEIEPVVPVVAPIEIVLGNDLRYRLPVIQCGTNANALPGTFVRFRVRTLSFRVDR